MNPELPVLLALALYKSVVGLARCLRMCRRDAGLPRALSPELVTLLGAVRASGSKRLMAPGLTDALAPRLLNLIEILVRTVFLALPEPVKVKKALAKKRERLLPHPVGASHWQPEGPDLNPHDVLAWHAEAVRAAADAKRAA
jgi:hypothetical protein